jgi:hypothetical protein
MQCSLPVAVLAILLSYGAGHFPRQNRTDHVKATETKKFRSFDHHNYEIIDTAYFMVYYRLKSVEKIMNKGVMWADQYYFSKTANDEIIELTADNLKRSFPGNHRFHYALDAQFRSEKQLMEYDPYLKQYKLKYLFSQSIK